MRSKIRRLALLVMLVALSVAISTAAVGQTEDDDSRDQIQRCIDAQPNNPNPRPCRIVNGEVIVEEDQPSLGGFAAFAVFALAWSAVPLIAGTLIASSRGQSVGLALLLTFFLGWIGLAIVWFGLKRAPTHEGAGTERPGT